MTTTIKSIKKLPGVLAFSRGHICSDALFFNEAGADKSLTPVYVIRHGIRGTQNNEKAGSTATLNPSNIQITETAKLSDDAQAVVVRFDMTMLDIGQSLHSCSGENQEEVAVLRQNLSAFIATAREDHNAGMLEIGRRYARNILNGRWLWRNRSLARQITITVSLLKQDMSPTLLVSEPQSLDIPLNHFRDFRPSEMTLGNEIADQMRGKSVNGLRIEARIALRVAGAIEVFPSQNYVTNKPPGFARPLYKVGISPDSRWRSGDDVRDYKDIYRMGQAALRDQKVFNAIRTIDTWFAAYEEVGFPIAVEPMGANLAQQTFYRDQGKQSAGDFLRNVGNIATDSPDGLFLLAALDRGGVYGQSDKAEKTKKADTSAAESGTELS